MNKVKQLSEFPFYWITDTGTVLSCYRRTLENARILKPTPNHKGYLTVILLNQQGQRVTKFVHHLVLEAFIGPCPPGMQCRHFPDRNPANNNLKNLQWGTALENSQDKMQHGTMACLSGESHPMATVSESDVNLCRKLARRGVTSLVLAEMMDKSLVWVSQVLTGRTWKTASEPPLHPDELRLINRQKSKLLPATEKRTLIEIAADSGLHDSVIRNRLKRGMSLFDCLKIKSGSRPNGRVPFTESDGLLLKKLFLEGYLDKEISKIMGFALNTIINKRSQLGLRRKSK